MRPKERRNRIAFSDPTANEALANVTSPKRQDPDSITDFRQVEPWSKFNDDTDWKGRRRLLRGLNRELSNTSRANPRRSEILNEMRRLTEQQFISRVSPAEARRYAGRRRF